MTSSPIHVLSRHLPDINQGADGSTGLSLRAVFETVPDPRRRWGIRHRLAGVLLVCACAVMSGAKSFAAIRDWAEIHRDMLARSGAKPPSKHTVRRVLGLVDADLLDRLLGRWALARAKTRAAVSKDPLVLALDGKEVRGAKNGGGQRVFLLSAVTHDRPVVVGQVSIGSKTNEIPEVKTLLAQIGDIHGMVLTLDALHCQQATAELIHEAGAYYLLTVKGNQPSLLQRVSALPWGQVSTDTEEQTGHGRKIKRTHKLLRAPDLIDFPHAVQVAQVRRTVTRKGKKRVEVVYLITSAGHRDAPPDILASWIQNHWRIEVRHEALCYRTGVRDLRCLAVAAAG